ncbi:MbnP family copper-binding protein [Nannocystaceae bacterium ST9]
MLPITACDGDDGQQEGGDEIAVELRFAAQFGDEAAVCGQTYAGIGSSASDLTLKDLRFYVSGVELIDVEGVAHPLALEQDGAWQSGAVALLDFEDGTAGCQESGTVEVNTRVIGSAPAGDYRGVRFVLGVPEALNHHDVNLAGSPLDLPSMSWSWQGGYKFLRIDLANEQSEAPGWFIHLGSTGCESAGPDQPPTEPCARPDRPTITLTEFDHAADVIVFDVASLLADADVGHDLAGPPGCMSAPDDPECASLFAKLGLDLDTGSCVDRCENQQAFRVE